MSPPSNRIGRRVPHGLGTGTASLAFSTVAAAAEVTLGPDRACRDPATMWIQAYHEN